MHTKSAAKGASPRSDNGHNLRIDPGVSIKIAIRQLKLLKHVVPVERIVIREGNPVYGSIFEVRFGKYRFSIPPKPQVVDLLVIVLAPLDHICQLNEILFTLPNDTVIRGQVTKKEICIVGDDSASANNR